MKKTADAQIDYYTNYISMVEFIMDYSKDDIRFTRFAMKDGTEVTA